MTETEKACIQELVTAMEDIARAETKLREEKKQLKPNEKRIIERGIDIREIKIDLLKRVLNI